jgi:hypothetical protein
MIFTPCRDGISHNEAEQAELDKTTPGVNVLLHAVLARGNRRGKPSAVPAPIGAGSSFTARLPAPGRDLG